MRRYDELKKYSLVEIYDYLNSPRGYTGERVSVSWLSKHLKPLSCYLENSFSMHTANVTIPYPVMNYEDNPIIGSVVECLTRYQLNGKSAYDAVRPQLSMHYRGYYGEMQIHRDWYLSRINRMEGYSDEAINAMYNFFLTFEKGYVLESPEVQLDESKIKAIREMVKRSVKYLSNRKLIFGTEKVEYGAVIGYIDFRTQDEIIDIKCISGSTLFQIVRFSRCYIV